MKSDFEAPEDLNPALNVTERRPYTEKITP